MRNRRGQNIAYLLLTIGFVCAGTVMVVAMVLMEAVVQWLSRPRTSDRGGRRLLR